MANRAHVAISTAIVCIAMQGCALSAKRWYAEIPLEKNDEWLVLYANHWRDRVDSLVVANCTAGRSDARRVLLIRARTAAVHPPEREPNNAASPTDEKYGEPLDLSAVNSRRLLTIESGETLAARADGLAHVCIRLAKTEAIDLGPTTAAEPSP